MYTMGFSDYPCNEISFAKDESLAWNYNKLTIYRKIMEVEDESWSVGEAITNLKNAMKENKQRVSDIFSSIDANDDGKINGPELYKGLIEHIGNRLSPDQVSMIIKALDINNDNRIDLVELSAAFEEE